MTDEGPHNGWHWWEWGAELLGTAILLFAVVTAKDWAVRAGPPVSDLEIRICIVGSVAGLAVIAIAFSRMGRRSGAHLNPAVTLGLWLQGIVAPADLAGYWVAQLVGGILGIVAGRVWGPTVANATVEWAVIAPASHLSVVLAAGIEAVATFVMLVAVYAVLSSPRYQRWTAVVAGVLLAVAIAALAQVSGAGFNPVRGLAPDVWAGSYPAVWIYFVGPLLGCLGAAMVLGLYGSRPLTGKLCHDPTIPCQMRCMLPHQVLPSTTTSATEVGDAKPHAPLSE